MINLENKLTNMSQPIDFKQVPDEMQEKLKQFKKALAYILKVNDPNKIVDDQISYGAIFYLKYILNDDEHFIDQTKDWKFLSKSKFDPFLINIFNYLVGSCDEFVIEKIKIARSSHNLITDLNERRISILDYLIIILNKLSDIQSASKHLIEFNKRLIENKIIDTLMSFYTHDNYLKKRAENFDPHDQMIGLMATIRNLSENPYFDKENFIKNNYLEVLKKFGKKCHYKDAFHQLYGEIEVNVTQKNLEKILLVFNELDFSSLVENDQVYHDFFAIKTYIDLPTFAEYELFKKYSCGELFEKLLSYYHQIKNELDFGSFNYSKHDKTRKSTCLNDKRIRILYYVLYILNKLIFYSIEMNIYFGKMTMIKILVKFLSEKIFTNESKEIKFIPIKQKLLLLVIKNLSIFSRYSDDNRKEWNDLNLIETLIELLSLYEDKSEANNQEIILSTYYTIGNIANDKQIEQLPETNFVIKILIDELVLIAQHLENNKYLEKIKIEILNEENKIEKFEVSYLKRALTGTLYGLTRFAVNFSTKKTIFEQIESIKTIIYKGNRAEKLFSLKLLAQLCFCDEIAEEVKKDTELHKFIRYVAKIKADSKRDLAKICQTILWSLTHKLTDLNYDKNIFISINQTKSDICSRLKQELEKENFKVFTSTDSAISENGIFFSSKSIEQCKYVLLCICEKYRLDENNQAEAQYSRRLNKELIPLVIQNDYENLINESGWIGKIIESKKDFINFVNEDFDLNFKHLFEKIYPIHEKNLDLLQIDVEKWDNKLIKKWFTSKKIHEKIFQTYENIDGFTLKQIYLIKTQTPEFFYQTLMRGK
jgi:hypothetical protein